MLILYLLFSTVHEVPFTCVKCIYFPTVSLWVMNPFHSENSWEMLHNIKQKDNKSTELLVEFLFSQELAIFKVNFYCLWWFFACHNHLFTHSLIRHDFLKSRLRVLNVSIKWLSFIHEVKSLSVLKPSLYAIQIKAGQTYWQISNVECVLWFK